MSVAGLNMRTTSSLESLNSTLGRSVPKHPHIFRFINFIKFHEFVKSCDMLCLTGPDLPDSQLERRRKNDREREEKIQFFTSKLMAREINSSEFLEAMGNKCILPRIGMILLSL